MVNKELSGVSKGIAIGKSELQVIGSGLLAWPGEQASPVKLADSCCTPGDRLDRLETNALHAPMTYVI